MSEQEIKSLKEQIKRELLEEMKRSKKENVWKRVKKEYIEEFKKFNYIDHWEALNCNNQLITRDKEVLVEYPMQNAIGTLLKIIYKVDSVSKITASYEDVKEITEKILNILKEKQKEVIYYEK